MNDPWDVKSVRHSGQYVSCMRLNGVPLLPPVLSKECRKEMQYYKLLAREVEKRLLYQIDSDNEDKTDAPDLPEYEQNYENISPKHNRPVKDIYEDISDPALESLEISPTPSSPNLVIDLNFSVGKTSKNIVETTKTLEDLPERDYNCVNKKIQKVIIEKQVITDVETCRSHKKKDVYEEVSNFSCKPNEDPSLDPLTEFHPIGQDGPSSLSSKSFTGSLNDIYSESIKEQLTPKLTRQRSYTLLKPSPQLLAHLEVQSLNTGVEMTSISMSESLSNLSTPHRKRRNWDLETAKEKWSSMATELKQNNFICGINKTVLKQHQLKKSPSRGKSIATTPVRKNGINPKTIAKSDVSPKSEPLPKKKYHSPVRTSSNRTFIKEPASPKPCEENISHIPLISEAEDPASRVRELYEKIQKQQLIQMASLVEKQKREQMLLQQVFEEQNNLLFKQLKNICPKSPIEAKQAWGVSQPDGDRGPVSLSQLINYKSPEQSVFNSPLSSTLTDTNQYLNQCDKVLKQSRDITGSIKKQQTKAHSMNGSQIKSPNKQPDGSRTRTHSPAHRTTITPRRLNYDTSSERENDPLLTDRTNDTLADLNVTFPSDTEADGGFHKFNNSLLSQLSKECKTPLEKSDNTTSGIHSKATEDAIRNMERTIHESINRSGRSIRQPAFRKEPTPKERAAATKIVAHAKGYLVRRLMKTDRVQATVQTIKDALLCALQLHQDREGIRGADVDLHRRLIQQITAACYSLHETFIASSAAERCTLISTDRSRRRSLAAKQPLNSSYRQSDIMSQSHTGVFPIRGKRAPPSPMTQSNYETFSADKLSPVSRRYMSSPRRRPWR